MEGEKKQVRRRRASCCARVALARSFLRAGGFSEHFFLGVLAGGSESHVSPNMFRLCPSHLGGDDRIPKMLHFLIDSRLSLAIVSGEELTKSEILQTLPPNPQ